MSDNERLIDSCNYLIKNRSARSFAEIAKMCGKNAQYFTDIKANKHIVSRFFLDELCDQFPILNKNWLLTGEGKMLRTDALGLLPENLGGDEDEEGIDNFVRESPARYEANRNTIEAKYIAKIEKLEAKLDQKDEQIDMLIRSVDRLTEKSSDGKMKERKQNVREAVKDV